MKFIKSQAELDEVLESLRTDGKTIGFVPTLGALHEGHGSLIARSKRQTDFTVCSIFVNPTQFNESTDLAKYPRTLDADKALLEELDCDLLFYPDVETVYPNGFSDSPDIDLQGLDEVLEGAFRGGHFDGVVQVVKRLLELVKPSHLYLGQKDFQQFSIVQFMIDYYEIPTMLVVCPIKREKSGLAMSSRNMRLTPKNRERAVIIKRTLDYAQRRLKNHFVKEVRAYAFNRMKIDGFRPEYFEIVDGRTLKAVESMDESDYIVACTAVWAGEIRLIDNKIYKKPKTK